MNYLKIHQNSSKCSEKNSTTSVCEMKTKNKTLLTLMDYLFFHHTLASLFNYIYILMYVYDINMNELI